MVTLLMLLLMLLLMMILLLYLPLLMMMMVTLLMLLLMMMLAIKLVLSPFKHFDPSLFPTLCAPSIRKKNSGNRSVYV